MCPSSSWQCSFLSVFRAMQECNHIVIYFCSWNSCTYRSYKNVRLIPIYWKTKQASNSGTTFVIFVHGGSMPFIFSKVRLQENSICLMRLHALQFTSLFIRSPLCSEYVIWAITRACARNTLLCNHKAMFVSHGFILAAAQSPTSRIVCLPSCLEYGFWAIIRACFSVMASPFAAAHKSNCLFARTW